MQGWASNFEPMNPKGMLDFTWITLRRVPNKFLGIAKQILVGLERVLEGDKLNSTYGSTILYRVINRFQIGTFGGGKKCSNRGIVNYHRFTVEYINLLIFCRLCFNTKHKVGESPIIFKEKGTTKNVGMPRARAISANLIHPLYLKGQSLVLTRERWNL